MRKESGDSEVIGYIDRWIEAVAKRTVGMLAKRAGMSEVTVRRVYQGESQPTFETVSPILAVVCSKKEQLDYLRRKFPEVMGHIETCLREDSTILADNAVEKYFGDVVAVRIIALTYANGNTTPEIIERILGDVGLKSANELVRDGVIREGYGQLLPMVEDGTLVPSPDGALEFARTLLKMFDADNIRTELAHISPQFDGFSEKGRAAIMDVMWNTAQAIFEIRKDKENLGDIPMYTVTAANVLDGRKGKKS